LDHYKTTLAIVLVFLQLNCIGTSRIGGEFFAASDSGEF
jgi:HAE1 family hydrophobic/amphiphilic exporter-1